MLEDNQLNVADNKRSAYWLVLFSVDLVETTFEWWKLGYLGWRRIRLDITADLVQFRTIPSFL